MANINHNPHNGANASIDSQSIENLEKAMVKALSQIDLFSGSGSINLTENHNDCVNNCLDISATSAIAPSANNMDNTANNADLSVPDSDLALGAMAQVALTGTTSSTAYTFSDKLNPDNLCSFIKQIYDMNSHDIAKCDAMILGTINVVSGLMGGTNGTPQSRSGIYGIYDGRRVFAPIYNIIYSCAGNDKGSLVFCRHLAHAIKQELRDKYDEEMEQYIIEMAEYESRKSDRGPIPQQPVYKDPFLPGNSSSSAIYRAIDANGGWGLMFETEADTISAMIDSDYGNYSDLMRKAHHHEPLSMNRVTEKLHIDIEEPRLSILLTCTPGQLPTLFPSFENGLGSRFLFYHLPDDEVKFHNVFANGDKPIDEIYKSMGDDLLNLFHALLNRTNHPIHFVLSDSQQKLFLETYSDILQEQFGMLGRGINAFVFRIALECFRYAMILTTLRRFSDWLNAADPANPDILSMFKEEENALICEDQDFDLAMTIIGCLINHTARVYSVLNNEGNDPFANCKKKPTLNDIKMYNALECGEFKSKDFYELGESLGIPKRSSQRILSNLCSTYELIIPVKRGVYRKPLPQQDEE